MIRKIYHFAAEIGNRKLFSFSASCCYYLFMSLVPIVMLICCILPYTPLTAAMLVNLVNENASSSLARFLNSIIITVYKSNVGTLFVAVVLTLFSSSASMRALMLGMDAAYGYKREENYLLFVLHSIIYMVWLVLAVVISLSILVYGKDLMNVVRTFLPDFALLNFLLSQMRLVTGILILIVFFLMLYKLMPSRKMPLLSQLPGAIFTSITWTLFSTIYSWINNISDRFGAYGVIGTVMAGMIWINYCFLFLLVGGYINSLWMHFREGRHRKKKNLKDNEP